jgi:putative ABC transport system ATP-binding protein
MLKLANITKSFNVQQARPVLDNLSLSLNKGEFCVVIGSNGSGKSTLLKTILGEYQPDKGSIELNGKNITRTPVHQRAKHISCVFQDVLRGTVSDMTVMENLSLANMRVRSATFKSHKKSQTFFKERLSLLNMGLENRLHTEAFDLSGGQRQAIAFTMATLQNPDLLLLDEHCSALDPKSSQHIMDSTTRIIEQSHITTLMVTHNLRDAIAHGTRLIMLHQGKIVLDVRGDEKEQLTTEQLLALFHQHEDKLLT